MKSKVVILALLALLWAAPASAAGLQVELKPGAGNPSSPQMGDHLAFNSAITNTGASPRNGIVAWISLVEVDKGHEQPVDLEDWSAHKAVSRSTLEPGQAIHTTWSMRLIKSGDYRVVVSAMSRDGASLTPSTFVEFHVRDKPVVESRRVAPVAVGIPAALALLFGFAAVRRKRPPHAPYL